MITTSITTFVDIVKTHFGYLEAEYEFEVIFAKNSEIRPQTDGVVKFASASTLVIIDSETGQAAVRFVRIQDDERYYLDPVSIHEYLNTTKQEKEILLSRNPSDKEAANNIFNKTFLLSLPKWKGSKEDIYADLEKQLSNYANRLKENASLCLLGNFSRWPEFYEYKINRLMADELRRGGKEFVKAIVKDESGSLKTIERPIFQREKDHLTRLRKEALGK
jgi:hypothetical protein